MAAGNRRLAVSQHFRQRFRDDLLAAAVLSVVGFLVWLDIAWPPFKSVFTWPSAVAWLEDGMIAAFAAWYFRDRVGRRLAAWWHQHQAPHLQGQLDLQNSQIQEQLDSQTGQFQERLDSQTGQIEAGMAVIRDNHVGHLRDEVAALREELAGMRRQLERLQKGGSA